MDKCQWVIFTLFMMVLAMARQATAGTQAVPAVESYDQLVSAIRQTKAQSRERIETLVESEKVREAWEIGKLIDAHVLQHKKRADYDKHVIERLAEDLGENRTELYYMLEFARTYPIVRPAGQLSWSHYQALLSLNDSEERKTVTEEALREGWTRDQVREEVRRRKSVEQKQSQAPTILTAASGKPGTYRIVKAYYGKQPNQMVADLGFSNYFRPPGKFPFKEGDIVKWNSEGAHRGAPLQKMPNATPADLFTYTANVVKVIDGDTFTAAVELGFGFTTVQTLRLRALDAPEIESAEGREAKEFLELSLRGGRRPTKQSRAEIASLTAFARNDVGGEILIKTHRSDKYDRYLADVFVEGEYVNQKLVEQGFAVPLSNEAGRV